MKRIGTVKNNIKLTKPFDDEANNEQAKDTAEGGAPVRRRRPSQPGSSTEMLGGNELLTSFGDTDNNLMSAADSSSALSNNFSGSSRDRSGSNQLNTDAWTSAMQSFQNTGRIDTNAMMPPSMNQLSTLQQQMGAHKSIPGLTPGQQNQMSLQDRLNAITDSGGVMNFAAMQLLAGGLGSGQNNSQQGLGNFDVPSSNTLGSGRTSNPQQQQGQQHQQSSSEQKGEGDEVLE